MVNRRSVARAIAVLAIVFLWFTPAKSSELEEGAEGFIRSLAEQAIQSLTDQSVSHAERVTRFRTMFNENFAVRSIGKFVLGRYWRKASDDEKTEYLALFEDLMVVSYVDRFARYAGETLVIKKSREERKNTATVFTEINRPVGAKPIRVNWLAGTDGKVYKILDVIVEGTSMSTTLRSDFGSIVRQKGGSVAGLIEELKKKTASLKANKT